MRSSIIISMSLFNKIDDDDDDDDHDGDDYDNVHDEDNDPNFFSSWRR